MTSMNHSILAHVGSQTSTVQLDEKEVKSNSSSAAQPYTSPSSPSPLGSAPPSLGSASGGSSRPMSPDDAVNAAINLQVGMILDLADITLSMGNINTTIQKTGVANGGSEVEMLRALLSAQGMCCNSTWFDAIVKGWASAAGKQFPDNAQGFMDFLKQQAQAKGAGPYTQLFSGVFNNPSISQADKDSFAQQFASFSNQCNGHLSAFLNKSSVIAQQLNQASTYVQNWQSIADAMKPTQLQQATTELVAEIGAETSMWKDVVSA